MNNQRSFFYNVDWVTVFIYLALCAIGWLNIHSAIFDERYRGILDFKTDYSKQFWFILVSIIVAIVVLLLESRLISALAPTFYGGTILLLMLVLVVGRNVGGNRAWISLGAGIRLQPAEFAKYTTCLLLARYLSSVNVKVTELRSFLISMAIIGAPMLLILLQPDMGSTLVFYSLIFVLYREGLSPYFLIISFLFIVLFLASILYPPLYVVGITAALAAALITLLRKNRRAVVTLITGLAICVAFIFSVKFIYTHVLQSHQKARIDILLGVVNDPHGQGYNVAQSKIAIGSGKLWGKGYMHGTQTKYSFVPAQSTDFIFSTVGEEWGFMGSVVVLGLYAFLILRLIFLAERQRSPFSRIYGYGVASVIFFHVMVNIATAIGLAPVIGIPLPLISYGGSSLISFTLLIFTLIKLDSNRMGIV